MTSTPAPAEQLRADLVLEGGGVKGIALLGAVLAFADAGYTFPRVAGTSAGALVAVLVAACTAKGHDVRTLRDVMRTLDYRKFRDETLLDRFSLPGKAVQLWLSSGVYSGGYVHDWVAGVLRDLGVVTFGDLRIDDDPGSDLAMHQRYHAVVHATDVSRGRLARFPWDYHHYGLRADEQRVADAVRASTAIPFYFMPVTLRSGNDYAPDDTDRATGEVTLVDGGLLANFPITAFDRVDGKPARWPTFGVKLEARPEVLQRSHRASDPLVLGVRILETLLASWNEYHLDDEQVASRTVFVDTSEVSPIDFDISAATADALFAEGYAAAQQFLPRAPQVAGVSPPPGSGGAAEGRAAGDVREGRTS